MNLANTRLANFLKNFETKFLNPTKNPIIRFGFILLVLSFVITLVGHITSNEGFNLSKLFEEIWANLGAELGSIAITVLIIDSLNKRQTDTIEKMRLDSEREKSQRLHEFRLYIAKTPAERENLIYEMHVQGILEGANLTNLDLTGVKLGKLIPGTMLDPALSLPSHEEPQTISLRRVNLSRCNLTDADLTGVDLRGAYFNRAILTNTILDYTDLRGASFGMYTDIDNVSFKGANLEGMEFNRIHISDVDFTNANIKGVYFYRYGVHNMILPNGQPLQFAEDLEEFGFRISVVGFRGFPRRDEAAG